MRENISKKEKNLLYRNPFWPILEVSIYFFVYYNYFPALLSKEHHSTKKQELYLNISLI